MKVRLKATYITCNNKSNNERKMTRIIKFLMTVLLFSIYSNVVFSKPVACTGISKKCTKDITFDKTIDGKAYSCYECKQTLCKSGGSGGIAGSQTSSVCELKTSTSNSQLILKHKPIVRKANSNAHFDEADSIFARRTAVRVSQEAKRKGTIYRPSKRPEKIDHRNSGNESNSDRSNETVHSRRGRRQGGEQIPAPTRFTLSEIKQDSLTLSWIDNASTEYGVAIERGIPKSTSRGINYQWQQVFKVQERIMSKVEGTGWRFDTDNGLKSRTQYCYRIRAYDNKVYSTYTYPVCVFTP